MTSTVTYDRVIGFINTANAWLAREENSKTKLAYAISRVMPRARKIIEKCQEDHQYALEDANNEFCMTDEKTKAILKDERGELIFTAEGAGLRNRKIREWFREMKETQIEIEPYFATQTPKIPDEMGYAEADTLVGFVLREVPEPVETSAAAGD